jgi:hypothetical protein
MPRKASKKKNKNKKYRKETIPKALREQTWLQTFGKCYEHKCYVNWCENEITVFDFHVGHDKPESKGGKLDVSNLKPICARCNLSMSNNYTIAQWNNFNKRPVRCKCLPCFF